MSKTPQWNFRDARELFESARDAAMDADRIRRQLAAMEERARSMGGGGFEPRVTSSPNPEAMAERINALVDREAALRVRQRDDWALIELASWVLYGKDNETGLAVLVPTWWCDAIWWHYLAFESWAKTAEAVGYSEQRCKQVRDLAFETVDSWGLVATMQGRPLNDYETWERDERRRRDAEKH